MAELFKLLITELEGPGLLLLGLAFMAAAVGTVALIACNAGSWIHPRTPPTRAESLRAELQALREDRYEGVISEATYEGLVRAVLEKLDKPEGSDEDADGGVRSGVL